ncbi:MAG TPA: hypothetical protein EYQ50_07755 [Verrucomicrobiales bacterium]|jgi:hypothetical protein|nr:hypothetical protein [Verrucomicrobiales bacterium]HIL72184.1 hypothetical protein [Verrucomicrobiota bacterium]
MNPMKQLTKAGIFSLILSISGSWTFAEDKIEIDDLKEKMSALAKKLPTASDKKIVFEKDIKPLLEKSCYGCHGDKKRPKGKFRIDNREKALKGGSEGVAIVSGKSAKSSLMYYITDMINEYEMPPLEKREKYPKLTKKQIGLVRAWIDQDLKFD